MATNPSLLKKELFMGILAGKSCTIGMLGDYCYPLPNCLLPFSDMHQRRVLAPLGLSVEDGPTVQVHFQPTIIYWGNGYSNLTAKLAEELGRYPSGLWEIPSTNAVLDFQIGLIFCH